jgi:hypothetical protein
MKPATRLPSNPEVEKCGAVSALFHKFTWHVLINEVQQQLYLFYIVLCFS